ncbi:hypothetical protein ACFC63_07220 [Streptomyces albidoflavus]
MRRTEYDEGQAAKRLKAPVAAFRWARHTGLIPAPDASSFRWSRAAVEALDADAINRSSPSSDSSRRSCGSTGSSTKHTRLMRVFGIAPETAMKYAKAAHPHRFTKDPTQA